MIYVPDYDKVQNILELSYIFRIISTLKLLLFLKYENIARLIIKLDWHSNISVDRAS